MLFYLDPPYWGCEDDYGKSLFDQAQYQRMAERLALLKGRFIMSLNAVPEAFKTFSRFRIEEVPCNYSIARGQGKAVTEVIITPAT